MKLGTSWLFIVLSALEFVDKVVLYNKGLSLGDECEGPRNLIGTCTRVNDCKFYMKHANYLEKRTYLGNPDHYCAFDGDTPYDQVVCCPSRCKTACKKLGHKPETPLAQGFNIINGEKAEVAEFPHFAALRSNDEGKLVFNCAGVLISKKFVLTAAHCAVPSNNLTAVRLGRTSLVTSADDENDFSKETDVNITNITLHPLYNVSQKYHDIALLELENPVEFDYNIWPACLSEAREASEGLKILTIAGFGYTKDYGDGGKKSDWMMKAVVDETPFNECKNIYDKTYAQKSRVKEYLPNGLIPSQVCAMDEIGKATTCQGDSGSGLMYNLTDQFYVHGITSFGPSCKTKLPSIYARVSSYIEWIENIVWPFE